MKDKKTKILFKSSLFAFPDMIATRDLPQKSRMHVSNLQSTNVDINYNVNAVAESLHPKYQEVVVFGIINEDKDTKTLILKPKNKDKKIAFFRAGQYISVVFNVNGTKISRPYSLSSSPDEALRGNFYCITVKRKPKGFISEYILNKIKVNDLLTITGPEGEFYYDNLRDKKDVLAIAGGSGITPFLSMAKAIVDNREDFNLTIIFGNKKRENIIFYKQLDNLSQKSKGKVKVIHVLSEEKHNDFENGFIDLKLIKKYKPNECSIFMCGPKLMYDFVLKELKELNLPKKLIRVEATNEIGSPLKYKEYVNLGRKEFYNIKVIHFNETYNIKANYKDTILVSLQKAKIPTQSKCLSGQCSWCRIKVNSGKVFAPKEFENPRAADHKNKIYYSCSTFPVSDLEIESY